MKCSVRVGVAGVGPLGQAEEIGGGGPGRALSPGRSRWVERGYCGISVEREGLRLMV